MNLFWLDVTYDGDRTPHCHGCVEDDIAWFDSLLGLHKRMPILAAVLLAPLRPLAGIPPPTDLRARFNLFLVHRIIWAE